MTTLADQIDVIAELFFRAWRLWRIDAGWSLGPDRPDIQMSPHLVDTWDMLTPDGKSWFRQHAALVIYAAGPHSTVQDDVVPAPDGVTELLEGVLAALRQNHTKTAKTRAEDALRLLKPEG